MLQKFHIFLGHLPGQGGCFIFGFSPHYITQMLQLFSGHLHVHGAYFVWVFRTLHHPDAPAFLGTFTRTWGLFFSGFPHTTSSSCSSFARDIYPDMGVVFLWSSAHCIIQLLQFCSGHLSGHRGCFFRVFRTLHHPVAPVLLGTFIRTQGLFFSGFPHTTSSSCSCFARDIYPDTGVVFFRFSAHCTIQLLRFCLGHLSRHRGSFLQVFRTLHHPVAPVFLRTLTQAQGLFFLGFSAQDMYPELRSFLGHFSAVSSNIYLDMGIVLFRFFCRILKVMLWRIQLFPWPFTYTPGSHHWIWVLGPTIIFRLIQAM